MSVTATNTCGMIRFTYMQERSVFVNMNVVTKRVLRN